jgi:Leucine-rich repeat (LRR) protein
VGKTSAIPIIYYEAARIPDDRPGAGSVEPDQFWEVREAINDVCRNHGSVGDDHVNLADEYDYWVVDDQYNDERYQYVEIIQPEAMTEAWLMDLMAALRQQPHWGVGINNIGEGYILVFGDHLMVTGPVFNGCTTIDDLVERAQRALSLDQMISASHDDASLECLSHVPGIEAMPIRLDLKKATDAGLAIAGGMSGVYSLDLDDSRVTDQGLACLKSLSKLEALYLQDTQIGDAGLGHLQCLASLKELYLCGCPITDEGLVCLKQLKRLEELRLDRTRITDHGLTHLAHIRTLRRLTLNSCQVGDAGLEYLQTLADLKWLSLERTKITSAGLVHLQQLRSLESRDFRGTRIRAKDFKHLKKVLPNCQLWV